jgi:hypothetical protein
MVANISNTADAVAYAVRDLSEKLAISPDLIVVAGSSEATWRDSSLGMPEPGKMYAQVLTEGFRVTLEACGKKYEYHFANGIVKIR